MAAVSRSQGHVLYRLLHNLSTVDLVYDDSKVRKKKKLLGYLKPSKWLLAKKIERYIATISLARHY